jgi:hypothetical protein
MKTKSEIIEALATVLDKHCKNEDEVSAVLTCITEFNNYMSEMSGHRAGITTDVRAMQKAINEQGRGDLVDRFNTMTDSFTEGMLISNQNSEGMKLIYQMQDEIQGIL